MTSEMTRRSFLKDAAVGAAGAAAAGLFGACAAASAQDAVTMDAASAKWDAEYDVIVVGYGAAGANTAINAADAGAKVLLTEKCEEGKEGGNSRYSGQGVQCYQDKDQALIYYKSLRGFWNTPSDAIIQAYADTIEDQRDYLISLGADPAILDNYNDTGKPWTSNGEFPELAGAGYMLYYTVSGHSFDGAYYQLLQENVQKRTDGIEVWFASPAVHLIQDPATKTILGVQINKEGKTVNVHAKNGVVLTTGGFENNQDMIQNYLQQPRMNAYGAVENTGDGIIMALEVGANLWHMSNMAGPLWCYKPPEADRGLSFLNGAVGIYVGPSGERYMNETTRNRHGRIDFGGRYVMSPAPVPAYLIADSTSLAANKFTNTFSDGNADEIAKGWFISGETIEELADNIAAQLPEEVLMPNAETTFQQNLIATVDQWNASCEAGVDARFERGADTLNPIKDGPFYALELGIMMYNTQGGPEKNEKGEILDRDGNPIPHLYEAGELGALWADAYNGGGNLGECTAFGRISGKNAAASKE